MQAVDPKQNNNNNNSNSNKHFGRRLVNEAQELEKVGLKAAQITRREEVLHPVP